MEKIEENEKEEKIESESFKEKQSKYQLLMSQVDPEILKKWTEEQNFLKLKLIEHDILDFSDEEEKKGNFPKIICGVDISASKVDPNKAVVGIVVIDILDFSIIEEEYELITMTQPYIPGFLAFREVDHLVNVFSKLKAKPDVILVDGNGILHSNRFGLASHLGVLLDLPTIGCGKSVFAVDGISSKKVQYLSKQNLAKKGDFINLVGDSKQIWGAAMRSTDLAYIPIIVSIGHKITLESGIKIILKSTNYRVPEPIRIADLTTRFLLRNYEKLKFSEFDIKEYLKKNKREFLVKDINI